MTYLIQPSFAGGELAPSLHARVDLAKYQVGLKTCRNFMVLAHGGVTNRAGTTFVGEVQNSGNVTRLIEFEFNTEQTYVLEFGDYVMRIIKDGGLVIDPGTGQIVEITTPYPSSDVRDINFAQSADTMTLCHPNYPPYELTRSDHHVWNLATITFGTTLVTPTGLGITANGKDTAQPTTTYSYKVTSSTTDPVIESLPSAAVTVNNNALTSTTTNTITWNAVPGADQYHIYKLQGGIHAYVGTSDGTSFTDDNIKPDMEDTPQQAKNPFSGPGNYPAVANYFQQRLVFAQTDNDPQSVFMSQSGDYHNFNTSVPLKDSDAITLTIASRQVNKIRHLVAMSNLMLLTSGGEWDLSGSDGTISPSTVGVKPRGYRGAAAVSPLTVGNAVLYVQAMGSIVRDLQYGDFGTQSGNLNGMDLTVMANHMFAGHTIVDWAYAQTPNSIIWAVRDDGLLLGLTYLKEHEVYAWHRHDTDGQVESVCSIREGHEDAVYFVVKRTVGGVERRYVERLHTRQFEDVADAFFVDCGLSYDGAPATTISGLDHLEGKTVSILADGNVHVQRVVQGGEITLNQAASKVHIGLPIEADIETLNLEVGDQMTQGRRKSISSLTIRVEKTRGGFLGPDAGNLIEYKQRDFEGYGDPIDMHTGDLRVTLPDMWGDQGGVFIRQSDPLPMTILAVIPEVTIGG